MHTAKLAKLPLKVDYSKIVNEVSRSQYSLGKLSALFRLVQNPGLLISPLLVKEATLSSRIEGTQGSIVDAYLFEAGEDTDFPDTGEIINYRNAMDYAREALGKKPLHLNLIKRLHYILMEDVRGAAKARGDFRKVQNWIGPPGATLEQATYVPPPPGVVMEYMDNFEKYIHSEERDLLVQAAIIHFQFECIHPFIDGNGRVGRMLIPLFLFEKKALPLPALYVSEYFESRRDEYYSHLEAGRQEGYLEDWIGFFLEGICWQVEKTESTITDMLSLYEGIKEKLYSSKSPNVLRMLDFIFTSPVFNNKEAAEKLGLNKVTVGRLVGHFVELGILDESKQKRNRIYTFKKLIRIVQS